MSLRPHSDARRGQLLPHWGFPIHPQQELVRQRRAGWQSAAGRAAVPAAGRAVKRAAEQPAALCRVARLPGPPSACCREGASDESLSHVWPKHCGNGAEDMEL